MASRSIKDGGGSKKKRDAIYPDFGITVITIGNSSDLNNQFQGKIASMYISDKYLQNLCFFLENSRNKLSIGYNQNSDANSKLIARDFWNSLIFKWNSWRRIPVANFNNFNACGFQWIHSNNILDSLDVNGGLKLWIPMIKKCDNQGIVWIIKIIGSISQVSNYFKSQIVWFNSFIENFCVALEESSIDPNQDFFNSCTNLINNLEWSRLNKDSNSFQFYYQLKAFNSIFLTPMLLQFVVVDYFSVLNNSFFAFFLLRK